MKNRVYVSNIPWAAEKDEIAEFFGEGVVEVHLPMDRETGRPRGFAFIEFETDEQANAAILNKNGARMGGRELRVSEAHERKDGDRGGRKDGGRRGDDRGGRREGRR